MRLQKIISQAGIASRRHAEEWIQQGKVTVNGAIARIGMKADPDIDHIKVKGKLITRPHVPKIYLIGNKPRNVITSLEDPQGRLTIAHMLKANKIRVRVFPVGRLDWDAEGLLLFTNDGDLAHLITHPRTHLSKVYHVKVKGRPSEEKLERLRRGIVLDGKRTLPARIEVERTLQSSTLLCMTLIEGRQNQIKRMCERIGHSAISITRIAIGSLRLGTLPRGKVRALADDERKKLLRCIGFV
jgi:23S rRNA pseudouridine2605 synthase